MALFPIRLDQAGGEYMESVLVTDWHKAPGDAVRQGELLVTVETAKAATEIEADRDGWLAAIGVPAGQEAAVGAALGHLSDTEGERPEPVAPQEPVAPRPAAHTERAEGARVIASPYARRLARRRGIALDQIAGTGPEGRIKARDLPPTDRVRAAPDIPLVLLHGFGADRTAWHGLRALLPAPVIALDLPGHGARGDVRAHSLPEIAADLAAQLDALGVEEMHLAGHSLGGAAALELTGLARQSVRSLTLIAPAGLGAAVSRGFTRAYLEARTVAEMETALHRMVADPDSLPPGLAAATFARLDSGTTRAALIDMEEALFAQSRAFDKRALLARLNIPLRVIWGAADRIVPQAQAAALPGHVALHRLPGIGHVPQIETPALTARLLVETLRSAP